MKFYISSAFLNTREIIEIAKAADDLGYHGIGQLNPVQTLPSRAALRTRSQTADPSRPGRLGRQHATQPVPSPPPPNMPGNPDGP